MAKGKYLSLLSHFVFMHYPLLRTSLLCFSFLCSRTQWSIFVEIMAVLEPFKDFFDYFETKAEVRTIFSYELVVSKT